MRESTKEELKDSIKFVREDDDLDWVATKLHEIVSRDNMVASSCIRARRNNDDELQVWVIYNLISDLDGDIKDLRELSITSKDC